MTTVLVLFNTKNYQVYENCCIQMFCNSVQAVFVQTEMVDKMD